MDREKMKKRKKSRLRSVNWSVYQTSLLLKLLKKKQQVLGEENFDSEVWEEITMALNKKSRPPQNPPRKADQLKMRFKTIRSEFHDYRACVEKPGWSWDSRRKLPIAPSDKLWDEAIESNKKLGKCRAKPFPCYKLIAELCGANVPPGENGPSEFTDDVMEEDDLLPPVSSLGAGTEQSAGTNSADDVTSFSGNRRRDGLEAAELEEELQNNELQLGIDAAKDLEDGMKQTKHRTRNPNWTDQQTSVLLDLLLEQYELGTTEYTEDFWNELCKILNVKTQPHRSPTELRFRLKTLKADFSDYRSCAETSEWYWDNEKGLPVPPNEAYWETMSKKLQRCRFKPFWWYQQVAKLCNKNPETGHHRQSWHLAQTVKEASIPLQLPLNSPEAYTEQSYNSAGGTPLSVGMESGRRTQAGDRNLDRMQETPKQMERRNKQHEVLGDSLPSIYKEATCDYKLVAKKLVKVRSQFKLSRSDFVDMSVVVRDELNRELFMEQEGKDLLDWIKDSLEIYREQRKAQQAGQQSASRPFYMPVYPYPPGGPYASQPHL